MMWNWFSKFIGKKESQQRQRVEFDIPFELYHCRKEKFSIESSDHCDEENNTI